MHIDVVTIFPQLIRPFLEVSLVGRAIDQDLFSVAVHDLREYTDDRHRVVDDEPYGGGGGMVMIASPWLETMRQLTRSASSWRVLMSPQGVPLDEEKVQELGARQHLILMCGRYEGLDERIIDLAVDEEISVGDYVLSGGELPAMVLIEAVSRQLPGVVGLADSVEQDSFRDGLLDHPHYTRPREVEGLEVPEVLLSGDHRAIERWRRKESLRATLTKRPDLLESRPLDLEEEALVEELRREEEVAGVERKPRKTKASRGNMRGSTG